MGRDWSEGSIKEEKNLTGKIQFIYAELQIGLDNYLLSEQAVSINKCFFASVSQLMLAIGILHS